MTQDLYTDGAYALLHPTWHTEDSHWKAKQIEKIISRNSLTPKTICEIGCGAGDILKHLSQHLSETTQFYGYDISPQAVQLCIQRVASERHHFFLRDLLTEPHQQFDIVLAIDVLEHIPDYMGFLERLRPRGTHTIFHIPLDLSVSATLRPKRILQVRKSVGHLHYFTKETALAALKDTGYDIVDSFLTAGSLELPRNTKQPRTIITGLPRRMLRLFGDDFTARVLGGFSLLVLTR
jgi:SAM-dependent methyltransferase